MDRGRREPALGQLVRHLGDGALGAGEDHRQAAALRLQDPGHHLDLVHGVRPVDVLGDRLERRPVVGGVDRPDVRGLGHEPAGQRHHGARHGRREHHHLPAVRRERQQPLDVGQEPQVEHLVGLVEHQHLHVRQVEVALLGQVEQSAGGADDHLDAAPQRLDLRLVGAPAVHGEHPRRVQCACRLEVAGHLHGQLAGRHHGQGLRLARGREGVPAGVGRRDHPLQHRDAEAQRLAGAGLGLADDVVAVQRDRQRHRLDRERRGDVHPGQRLDDVGADAVLAERTDRHLVDGDGDDGVDNLLDRGFGRQVCGQVGGQVGAVGLGHADTFGSGGGRAPRGRAAPLGGADRCRHQAGDSPTGHPLPSQSSADRCTGRRGLRSPS